MENKNYTQEEAMDALMAASGDGRGRGEGMVSEDELAAVAAEMGIDGERLREVLERGTGTVRARDELSQGFGWPGSEVHERVVSGELSEGALQELAGEMGSPMGEAPDKVGRVMREYWTGFRYITMEATVRDGRTRIVARSRPSGQSLLPMIMFVGMGAFVGTVVTAKKAPEFALIVLLGSLMVGLVSWLFAGFRMRSARGEIGDRIDRVAEMAREEIRRGGVVRESVETRLSEDA